MNKRKITKDMLICDVLGKYPELIEVMLERGLHCFGCLIPTWETVQQAAEEHGIDAAQLLKDLNEEIG